MTNRIIKTVGAGCVVIASLWAITASAIAFQFDEVTTLESGVKALDVPRLNWGYVPEHYQGFVWQGWNVVKADQEPGSYQAELHNFLLPQSPRAFAYNRDGAAEVVIRRAAAFTWDGAWFTSFAKDDQSQAWSAQQLTVEAYFAGRSVGSITFALSPTSLEYHHADFGTIDELVFRTDREGNVVRFWGMVGYDSPRVPDGGLTAILLGLSVLGLGVMRRMVK